MLPPLKLVIFDCDGTLIDSQHNIVAAMAHAFAVHGLVAPPRERVLSVVGLSLPQAFAVLAGEHAPAVRQTLATEYREAFAQGRIRDRTAEPLYPGVAEAVAALAARDDVVLGIATGKSRRGVARLLDHQGWHGHFVTIQTADDQPSKPHPAMILAAVAEAGVTPQATLMIGDTTFDMEMARAARAGAVGVGWGYHAVPELVAAGAHTVVEAGHELIDAIDERFRAQLEDA